MESSWPSQGAWSISAKSVCMFLGLLPVYSGGGEGARPPGGVGSLACTGLGGIRRNSKYDWSFSVGCCAGSCAGSFAGFGAITEWRQVRGIPGAPLAETLEAPALKQLRLSSEAEARFFPAPSGAAFSPVRLLFVLASGWSEWSWKGTAGLSGAIATVCRWWLRLGRAVS